MIGLKTVPCGIPFDYIFTSTAKELLYILVLSQLTLQNTLYTHLGLAKLKTSL